MRAADGALLIVDQRKSGIRRDINDLVRGVDGKLSGTKIGTYAGQIIAGRLLLINELPTWDVLAVLFLVLIAPEAYKQILAMRWGGGRVTQRSEKSTTSVSTSQTTP